MGPLNVRLTALDPAAVFSTVGMIPGIILLLTIGAITGWSAHVIGEFKRRHPHCHSVADVGQMWWGPVGRELFGALYWLCKLKFFTSSGSLPRSSGVLTTPAPSQT